MADDDTHPTVEFYKSTAGGKVAYSPPTEDDPEEHWFFNRERAGCDFTFVIHDRHDKRGLQIYPQNFRDLSNFAKEKEFEYIENPPERVQEYTSKMVEFNEEPMVIGEMKGLCPNCESRYNVNVMPKIDMLIRGQPVQRYFEETCQDCGEKFKLIETQEIFLGVEYLDKDAELNKNVLWEHSRRSI
jgi:hypothetical protein